MNPKLAEQGSLIRLLLSEKFGAVIAYIAGLIAYLLAIF
jgi:hypothetical protein